ncbi:gastrula zinc finger protein XlCGF8.2DB-like [Pimephales promelas]|nr:gastrula zinc finger protein XlCGF8.2DB-like [Pimephales promelas]
MAFTKEESEDMKIEETFSVKQEETEEQTDPMPLKEESQDLNEMSSCAVFNEARDVIEKAKLVAIDFRKRTFLLKKLRDLTVSNNQQH